MALLRGVAAGVGGSSASCPHWGRIRQPLVLQFIRRPDEAAYPRLVHNGGRLPRSLRSDLGSIRRMFCNLLPSRRFTRFIQTGYGPGESTFERRGNLASGGEPGKAQMQESSGLGSLCGVRRCGLLRERGCRPEGNLLLRTGVAARAKRRGTTTGRAPAMFRPRTGR